MKILITDPVAPEAVKELQQAKHKVDVKAELTPEELLRIIPDYHALIVRSATKVTAEVIQAGKNLKVIGRGGIGLDNIDVKKAKERGIEVLNTPAASSISVAELALALMFAVARKIGFAHTSLKKGKWVKKQCEGVELYGKVLGVIGAGRIGREVIKRAKGLGMKVVATDPDDNVRPLLKEMNVPLTSLEELLPQADYLTLHLPLLPSTRNLVDEKEFGKMKDGVILINASRGGVVNEKALVHALEKGKVAGAGIDVFEKEPIEADNPLLKFDTVVLTPHVGASTVEGQFRVGIEIARKVNESLKKLG